eukprot:3932230-Rhodomonas_salina.1
MIGKRFFGTWSWQYIPSAQGMSLLPSGKSLVFSGRYVLRRTQPVFPFATEAVLEDAIPEQFASAAGGGYDHIGDISTVVHEGEEVVLASIEEPLKGLRLGVPVVVPAAPAPHVAGGHRSREHDRALHRVQGRHGGEAVSLPDVRGGGAVEAQARRRTHDAAGSPGRSRA